MTGTKRDAILFAVGVNATHGKVRTNADKRRAVETLLTNEVVSKDDKGIPWADRDIARQCHVHHQLVARMRDELHLDDHPDKTRLVTRNGTTYEQNTANIGGLRTLASDIGRQLSPSQRSIVAAKARGIYDRQAKERLAEGQRKGGQARHGSTPVTVPECKAGDARDLAGKAVGVSGSLVHRDDWV